MIAELKSKGKVLGRVRVERMSADREGKRSASDGECAVSIGVDLWTEGTADKLERSFLRVNGIDYWLSCSALVIQRKDGSYWTSFPYWSLWRGEHGCSEATPAAQRIIDSAVRELCERLAADRVWLLASDVDLARERLERARTAYSEACDAASLASVSVTDAECALERAERDLIAQGGLLGEFFGSDPVKVR